MRDHPFAHVALRGTSFEEASEAIAENDGARAALNALYAEGKLPVRTCKKWSSADMRVLAIHGLTRPAGNRIDGTPLVAISEKGSDVLFAFEWADAA